MLQQYKSQLKKLKIEGTVIANISSDLEKIKSFSDLEHYKWWLSEQVGNIHNQIEDIKIRYRGWKLIEEPDEKN